MGRNRRYPQEVRERAVRMVFDQQGQYASQWEALRSISSKIGCSAETLRNWVWQAEVDTGRRGGLSSDEKARMKDLERENSQLKKLVADLSLDKEILQDVLRKKL